MSAAVERLQLNPFFTALCSGDAVEVTAVRRGMGMTRMAVVHGEDPRLFELLLRLTSADSGPTPIPAECVERLVAAGVLVAGDAISGLPMFEPRIEYRDESADGAARDGARMWNPRARLARDGAAPDDVGVPLPSVGWRRGAPMAWVPYALPGGWMPYWLSEAEYAVAAALCRRAASPADIDAATARAFAAAGLLVRSGEEAELAPPPSWSQRRERLVRELEERRFVVLRRALPAPLVSALARYAADTIREGFVDEGDGDVRRRFVRHNEPVFRFFHHNLAATVSSLAAEAYRPSFCYLSSYRRGAVLAPHTDRAQCELTISCLIDQPAGLRWPLRMERGGEGEELILEPGDMVVYRGCELIHSRPALDAEFSTSLLFHYVDESFSGSLD